MEGKQLRFLFEIEYSEMIQDIEPYVSAIFSSLESDFMNMPQPLPFPCAGTVIHTAPCPLELFAV
jgi:hypothetical protein